MQVIEHRIMEYSWGLVDSLHGIRNSQGFRVHSYTKKANPKLTLFQYKVKLFEPVRKTFERGVQHFWRFVRPLGKVLGHFVDIFLFQ